MDYDEANCPISCTGRCGLPILNTEHIFTRYKEFHVLSMQNRVDILLIRIKHWPKNVIWMVLKYEKINCEKSEEWPESALRQQWPDGNQQTKDLQQQKTW